MREGRMATRNKQDITDFKDRARRWNAEHPISTDRKDAWKFWALLLCLDNMHLANSRDIREFSRKQRRVA